MAKQPEEGQTMNNPSQASLRARVAAQVFADETRPLDPDRALLTRDEFMRLITVLALLNDTSVTQIDTDESNDLRRLLYKISNDGEEMPAPTYPSAKPVSFAEGALIVTET